MRQAVGERRTVVEDVLLGALVFAPQDRLEKRPFPLPLFQDPFLECGEVGLRVNVRVRHAGVFYWGS